MRSVLSDLRRKQGDYASVAWVLGPVKGAPLDDVHKSGQLRRQCACEVVVAKVPAGGRNGIRLRTGGRGVSGAADWPTRPAITARGGIRTDSALL